MLRCHAKMPFNTTRTTSDLDSDDVADKDAHDWTLKQSATGVLSPISRRC